MNNTLTNHFRVKFNFNKMISKKTITISHVDGIRLFILFIQYIISCVCLLINEMSAKERIIFFIPFSFSSGLVCSLE